MEGLSVFRESSRSAAAHLPRATAKATSSPLSRRAVSEAQQSAEDQSVALCPILQIVWEKVKLLFSSSRCSEFTEYLSCLNILYNVIV